MGYRKNKHIIAEQKRKHKKKLITWSSITAAVAAVIVLICVLVNIVNTIPADKLPTVTMEIEGYGTVEIELYPNEAPNTVRNFIDLANSGYYNNMVINRVAANFCIQTGSKDGTTSGGPGYYIKGEFASNGFKKNDIAHGEGIVSMARSTDPDSAGSQFFICVSSSSSVKKLDGDYAAFGKVISGLDIIKQISKVSHDSSMESTAGGGKPIRDVVIKSVTVDTKGIDYPKPQTINSAS